MMRRAEVLMEGLLGGELSKQMQRAEYEELTKVLGRKRSLLEAIAESNPASDAESK